MNFNIQLSGIDQVAAAIEGLERELVAGLQVTVIDTVAFAVHAIADRIVEYHAVDTGRLRDSIDATTQQQPGDSATEISPDGLRAIIGTNVSYAAAVHEGYDRQIKASSIGTAHIPTEHQGFSHWSRDESGSITRHVIGRPYMRDCIPVVERYFSDSLIELLARYGIHP